MKWKNKHVSNVRIFTEKGVEISQDGIPYIKNKGKYFCSKGKPIFHF